MANNNNISTNGIKITILPAPLPPFEADNFSPDSDILNPDSIQTAEMIMTPDGKSLKWHKNAKISTSLTFNGASQAAHILSECLIQQRRVGVIPSISFNFQITVQDLTTGEIGIYADGTLEEGPSSPGLGNEKRTDRTYKFSFGTYKRIPGFN